jgi:hypothetical protein
MSTTANRDKVIWRGKRYGITTTIDIDAAGLLIVRQGDEEESAVGLFIEQLPGVVAAFQELIEAANLPLKPDTP